MRILVAAAMVGVLAGTVARAQIPKTFQYDGQDLARTKQQYQAGDAHVADMVKELLKEADKTLAGPTYSVVNKPFSPPSGDKHDYMSLSPYWWPDPSKPDGKPYIRLVECKASRRDQMYHRVQVAVYYLLVRQLLTESDFVGGDNIECSVPVDVDDRDRFGLRRACHVDRRSERTVSHAGEQL